MRISDPITQLAFSLYEGKGVHALLVGSGLSRAAQIPTGWEITLDLIRRVGRAQGIDEQADWAAWYHQKTGLEPNYSVLLTELAVSADERRAILNSYVEPDEADRDQARKVPTAAHRAIAELVKGGFVRVIVTTNFDRLIETALREAGVEPTVIASVDSLRGAEPLTHSRCTVIKLHGDYKDARILNTDAELTAYPEEYDTLLDRIFDEYGLIVCGWSGEWDHALRSAMLRAPNRRYPVYWAAHGAMGDRAGELVQHRGGTVVPILDADSFFANLQRRVETLQQTHRENPLSVELLASSAKRLMAKPEYRIQLDDLITDEVRRVMEALGGSQFSPSVPWSESEFRARVRQYEAISEGLSSVSGILGRWGDGSEIPRVLDIIRGLFAQAKGQGGGLVAYIGLRSYPAVLALTAYGLGAVRAERWAEFRTLVTAELDNDGQRQVRVIDALFLWGWQGMANDVFKSIEGLERRKTPFSDHLLEVFTQWGMRFLGLVPDFERLFGTYEMLGSLAQFERNLKEDVQRRLTASSDFVWMPVGRLGWDETNASKIVAELEANPLRGSLLRAGFSKNDSKFLDLFVQNFNRIAARM